ncbi:MAG: D-alanine--D-alanine ligase, partial [Rhodothermia bacterium]
AGSDVLSFEQKYQRGTGKGSRKTSGQDAGMASLNRIIPADVPGGRENQLRDLAVKVFEAVGCSGVARIDFLYDTDADAFYFNEINTVPGSFSFYLWEPSGIPFDRLLDELIDCAIRDHRSRNAKIRSYETNLLSENALSGVKT